MRRLLAAGLLALTLSTSTGCCLLDSGCLVDSIFSCPCYRWRGGGCPNNNPNCGSCCNNAGARCQGPYGNTPNGPGYFAPGGAGMQYADDGPPTGHVAYPYYTNRGPRDFLAANPGDIGP